MPNSLYFVFVYLLSHIFCTWHIYSIRRNIISICTLYIHMLTYFYLTVKCVTYCARVNWARICKLDSKESILPGWESIPSSWLIYCPNGGPTSNRFLGSLKGLQIRAVDRFRWCSLLQCTTLQCAFYLLNINWRLYEMKFRFASKIGDRICNLKLSRAAKVYAYKKKWIIIWHYR